LWPQPGVAPKMVIDRIQYIVPVSIENAIAEGGEGGMLFVGYGLGWWRYLLLSTRIFLFFLAREICYSYNFVYFLTFEAIHLNL
jgi:hypothetical protein